MQIIPVIDLKGGLVVHAIRGDRKTYQPIHHHSKLVSDSHIDAVLSGFLTLYPFETFYIADLDAIVGQGNHNLLIERLLASYPHLNFWVDNGSQFDDVRVCRLGNCRTVIGTESQTNSPGALNQNLILSLDFKQGQPAGDPAWFAKSALWPKDVIVMTLSRVGSGSGPELQRLMDLRSIHPDKHFIAAGGIRDNRDLIQLSEIGIGAALIATALHAGALSAEEIADLRTKKYPGKPGYF